MHYVSEVASKMREGPSFLALADASYYFLFEATRLPAHVVGPPSGYESFHLIFLSDFQSLILRLIDLR